MNVFRRLIRSKLTPAQAIRNVKTKISEILELKQSQDASEEEILAAENGVFQALGQVRFMLIGDTESPATDEEINKICIKFLRDDQDDLLQGRPNLVMFTLEFAEFYPMDAQKELSLIINYIIKNKTDDFKEKFNGDSLEELLGVILNKYGETNHPRLQIQMSSILREMMKNDADMHHQLLFNPNVEPRIREYLFDFVKQTNFDVASDAFNTLKSFLTKNKDKVFEYLRENYEQFFYDYNQLILSPNYVTKRQSLKLLGDILLEKENKTIMMKYIGEKQNLKLLMMLLKDKSKAITFEAFHVFKVFVANPHPKPEVYKVLFTNKERLVAFLESFQEAERENDEQFMHEKRLLITKLTNKMSDSPADYAAKYAAKPKKAAARSNR